MSRECKVCGEPIERLCDYELHLRTLQRRNSRYNFDVRVPIVARVDQMLAGSVCPRVGIPFFGEDGLEYAYYYPVIIRRK